MEGKTIPENLENGQETCSIHNSRETLSFTVNASWLDFITPLSTCVWIEKFHRCQNIFIFHSSTILSSSPLSPPFSLHRTFLHRAFSSTHHYIQIDCLRARDRAPHGRLFQNVCGKLRMSNPARPASNAPMKGFLGAHNPIGQMEAWYSANPLAKRPKFENTSLPIYPQRPGEKDCAHYMQTRTCKFGEGCKFDHPILVPEGGIPYWKEIVETETEFKTESSEPSDVTVKPLVSFTPPLSYNSKELPVRPGEADY